MLMQSQASGHLGLPASSWEDALATQLQTGLETSYSTTLLCLLGVQRQEVSVGPKQRTQAWLVPEAS